MKDVKPTVRLLLTFSETARVKREPGLYLVNLRAPKLIKKIESITGGEQKSEIDKITVEFVAAILRGFRSYHEQRKAQKLESLPLDAPIYFLIDFQSFINPVFHQACMSMQWGCAYYLKTKAFGIRFDDSIYLYPPGSSS